MDPRYSAGRTAFAAALLSASTAITASLASFAPAAVLGVAALSVSSDAQALTPSCGTPNEHGLCINAVERQFDGGFNTSPTEVGGFGGAFNCTITKTPVVFIHGNGDNAISWNGPPRPVTGFTTPPRSVYQELKNFGYKDCELFGVTYLNSTERQNFTNNFHQPSKYNVINGFITKVLNYTGRTQVDVVTHSMGVTMASAAFTFGGTWGKVRRFVAIAGGMRGLESCYAFGNANLSMRTCASQGQSVFGGDVNSFGFYPGDNPFAVPNQYTSTSNSSRSVPNMAINRTAVGFYTIAAGKKDQIICGGIAGTATCANSAKLLINGNTNVKAQVNVGAGADQNGDANNAGVGHFRARSNTGKIILKMLSTTCTTGCAVDYVNIHGPAVNW